MKGLVGGTLLVGGLRPVLPPLNPALQTSQEKLCVMLCGFRK